MRVPFFFCCMFSLRANALDNEPGKSIIYNVGTSKNSPNGNL